MPRCPAADHVAGASPEREGVVCRVQQREGEAADRITEGSAFDLLTLATDPSTIYGFCCGTAMVPVSLEREGERAHYACCPIWQAELKRVEDAQRRAWSAPREGDLQEAQIVGPGGFPAELLG